MNLLRKTLLFRLYNSRTEAEQMILLCTVFSLSLVFFRVLYTATPLFLFLVWNLFLAFIPFALSNWMERNWKQGSRWKFLVWTIAWLAFIPNAFYIITDLFHLRINSGIPLWYDLILLLSFGWNGLLFGMLSVRQMEKLFETCFNKKPDLLFILPVMFLNALGVYIGRYLRFNSWDIITNPFALVEEIFFLFIHPVQNRFDWSMIICYTAMMTLIYLTIKKLGRIL